MQALGAEMNLAETAFLWPEGNGWRLRWFTPTVEVDLCGHATLAAAHILYETGAAKPAETISFQTLSGELTVKQAGLGIEMNFPAEPAVELPSGEVPDGLIQALNLSDPPRATGRSRLDLLVELVDEAAVRALTPDLSAVAELNARGVIVTSRAGTATAETTGVDFVSRFFAPAVGVAEDPVTGSAHCTLGPWWTERLGRNELLGAQVSRRGGIVGVVSEGKRVLLSGSAVTIICGELGHAARLD
jgi:PhzF family phenazine biosynthesis protein